MLSSRELFSAAGVKTLCMNELLVVINVIGDNKLAFLRFTKDLLFICLRSRIS